MIAYIATKTDSLGRDCFGVAAVADSGEIDWVSDAVCGLEEAIMLSRRLQRGGVAREHFRDVLCDYVGNCT